MCVNAVPLMTYFCQETKEKKRRLDSAKDGKYNEQEILKEKGLEQQGSSTQAKCSTPRAEFMSWGGPSSKVETPVGPGLVGEPRRGGWCRGPAWEGPGNYGVWMSDTGPSTAYSRPMFGVSCLFYPVFIGL